MRSDRALTAGGVGTFCIKYFKGSAQSEFVQDKISELLERRFTVSVEVFPPRNGHSPKIILDKIARLKKLKPDFISITKGAMGSMRGGTVPIGYMIAESGMTPLVHFRSRDHTRREVENLLVDHTYFGIRNILAVMGDPVAGEKKTIPRTHNRYASDLVRQIADMNRGLYQPVEGKAMRKGEPSDFCIGVAAYPEREEREETKVMRAKVAAGADFSITQMFFDAGTYASYRKRMGKFKIPFVAGVRPVTRPEHVEAAERIFGAKVPDRLKRAIAGKTEKAAREACADFTVRLCRDAAEAGAPGIHLFILNDVELAEGLLGEIREAVR
jgi:methylenetetrahydrofolate reductase (NADPH)